MRRFAGIRRALRVVWGKRAVQREVDDELSFHLAERADALRAGGLPTDAAHEEALREFGDLAAARRELAAIDQRVASRAARAEWWSDLGRDAVLAARMARREIGTTIAIVMTLAVSVGASTAIFTIVHEGLLRPLPYTEPERLVHLWETQEGVVARRSEASYPDFADWRERTPSFERLEGYDPTNVTLAGGDSPVMLSGGRVTAGFFAMLGVKPALGRLFDRGEDAPGGARVVVLSHGIWERRYGADRGVIGRPAIIDGRPYEIVGVLPSGFHFAPIGDAELWLPLDQSAETRAERSDRWLNVVGRLRSGAPIERARAEVATVMRALATAHPATNSGRSALVVPLRDEVVGDVRPLLLVLAGAVVLVLAIACANVAALLLARALARGREMAVRAALGASRWRLVRQVLTESVLLAIVSALAAVGLARGGVQVLIGAIPDGVRDGMPFLDGAQVDGTVLGWTLAAATLVGVLFGMAPAAYAARASLAGLLQRGGRATTGGSGRLRDVLVVAEIALTVVLLVGTGLLVRSLTSLLGSSSGFVADEVVTARIALAGSAYADDATQRRFFEELLAGVRGMPGVRAAGAASHLPLNGGGTNTFRVEGRPEPDAARRPEAMVRGVAGEYFRALRIPLVAGRTFSARDDSAAAGVVIINASLAHRLFPGEEALGARLRFHALPERTWEVIGVVADVKTGRLDEPAPPTVYHTHLQGAENRMSLAVRADGSPGAMIDGIRRLAASLDPAVPVYATGTMTQQMTDSPAVFARRYPLLLVGLFAGTALVLAVVGLYGILAHSVAQRKREIGIRMALGARPGVIVGAVTRHGLAITGLGVIGGAGAAAAMTGLLGSLLYGVEAHDPASYVGAAAVLGFVALGATAVPAWRAARVEPTVALRAEP